MKWRLIFKVLPLALLLVLLTYLRNDILLWPSAVEFSHMTAPITGVVLIIGFMLANAMADHKDSERLPGQLASALESYSEVINGMAANNGELDAQELRNAHFHLVVTAEHWLLNPGPNTPCFTAMRALSEKMENSKVSKGIPTLYQSAVEIMGTIRGAIGRIGYIRNNSIIPSGYALLQTMVGAVLILLVFAKFPTEASQYAIIGLLSLVLICFTLLISDLDDPFEYSKGAHSLGTNEVNPSALVAYREYVELTHQNG